MSSFIYCLLSAGNLNFLPFDIKNNIKKTSSSEETATSTTTSTTATTTQHNDVPSGSNTENHIAPEEHQGIPSDSHNYSQMYTKTPTSNIALLSPSISSTSLASSFASSSFNTQHTPDEVIDLNNGSILAQSSSSSSSSRPNPHSTAHSLYLPNHHVTLSSSSSSSADGVSTDRKLRKELFKILSIVFPNWTDNKHDLQIKRLTGGITNMLLSVTHIKTNETVLVRTYGQGTSLIIDRDREFVSQLFLNSLDLASRIHARFSNGLVYGFLPGRSASPDELSHPMLYPLIAQRLGHWHSVIRGDDIEEGVIKLRNLRGVSEDESKLVKDIWELIADWINVLPEVKPLLDICFKYRSILESDSDSLQTILRNELKWLIENISTKSSVVSCHSDLLSGNVIIPESLSAKLSTTTTTSLTSFHKCGKLSENPVSFIDYEYMLPAPRAFDISNHFMEWQGFECDKSKIPIPSKENDIMKNWAEAYLSVNDDAQITEAQINQLIDEISLFYGLPGFYWGIWAGIQSTISLIDFDYATYCSQRFEEYLVWKQNYLQTTTTPTTASTVAA